MKKNVIAVCVFSLVIPMLSSCVAKDKTSDELLREYNHARKQEQVAAEKAATVEKKHKSGYMTYTECMCDFYDNYDNYNIDENSGDRAKEYKFTSEGHLYKLFVASYSNDRRSVTSASAHDPNCPCFKKK